MKVNKLISLLEEWKFNYPFDPKKTIELISEYADYRCRSSHLAGMEINDNYDDETSGVDIDVPHWVEIFDDGLTTTVDLKELAKLNKKVNDLISDRDNFKLSWGESGGMMPNEDANYPKDAIITNIFGDNGEPHQDIEFGEILRVAKIKPKYKEIFKNFLKEDWTRRNLGFSSDNEEIDKIEDDEDTLTFYDVFEIVFAVYIKKADFMKAVKGAKSKEEKELIKSILDRVGSYE